MRTDWAIWLATGIVVLAGGLFHSWQARRAHAHSSPTLSSAWQAMFPSLGLAGVLAGLGWRLWSLGVWPGSTAADALVMLAGGALLVSGWRPGARDHVAHALTLLGISLLLFGAVAHDWNVPASPPTPQARAWLLGLRGILAGIGLGGWLPVLASNGRQLWVMRQGAGAASNPGEPGWGPLCYSYPWLTAAWLVGGGWDLATHAAVWRGVPAELWLIVAWLIGGLYLHASWAERPPRLPLWLMTLLAGCGVVAALLVAWQTPSLF